MESLIAKLLTDFEQGKMSRRQLIQSLAMASAAAGAVGTASAVGIPKRSHGATRLARRNQNSAFRPDLGLLLPATKLPCRKQVARGSPLL